MIKTKEDYQYYLTEDKKASEAFTRFPIFSDNIMVLLTDPCWKFQKLLRKLEYWSNCKNAKGARLERVYLYWLRKRFQKMSSNLGFSIPINVFGPGLCIVHYGSIVVSRHAKIGKNCTIHSCVNIGGTDDKKAATIGDNCLIGPGVKIFNNITIGDNVKIGANAVVNKSFGSNVTVAGIPAKIIKENVE